MDAGIVTGMPHLSKKCEVRECLQLLIIHIFDLVIEYVFLMRNNFDGAMESYSQYIVFGWEVLRLSLEQTLWQS